MTGKPVQILLTMDQTSTVKHLSEAVSNMESSSTLDQVGFRILVAS